MYVAETIADAAH